MANKEVEYLVHFKNNSARPGTVIVSRKIRDTGVLDTQSNYLHPATRCTFSFKSDQVQTGLQYLIAFGNYESGNLPDVQDLYDHRSFTLPDGSTEVSITVTMKNNMVMD